MVWGAWGIARRNIEESDMAGRSSLPSFWEAVLDNPTYARPYLECILDPDGENITLEGVNGLTACDAVLNEIDIDPEFSSEIVLQGMRLTFRDPDEFYASFSGRSSRTFRKVQRVLAQAASTTEAILRPGLFPFSAGDEVTFSDGTNSERKTLVTASDTVIAWSGNLTNSYAAGSLVSTIPITGSEVLVRLKLDNTPGEGFTDYINLYRGVVREPFKWEGTQGVLELDSLLGKLLNKPMRIHSSSTSPTDRMTSSGNLETSFVWSDDAETTLSGITVYAGAQLGQWTVSIISGGGDYNNLLVTGPGIEQMTGRTDVDFYDGTDSSDSQICIPAANWGTPTDGDQLIFYISANFQQKTVPEVLYEILKDYGGISSSYIDVGGTGVTDTSQLTYSFNKMYSIVSDTLISLSIDEEMTVMQAVLMVQPHGMCYLGQMVGGNLRVIMLHPDFRLASLTPDAVGNPEVSHSDLINEFKVYYNWSYNAREYAGFPRVYPENDGENASYLLHGKKVSKEIFCPGINN